MARRLPPPSAAPERSTTPVSQASIAGRVEVTTDTTLQAASVPPRVVTLRAANLRERPDASARVLACPRFRYVLDGLRSSGRLGASGRKLESGLGS